MGFRVYIGELYFSKREGKLVVLGKGKRRCV